MIEHVFPPEMMQERERQLILALSDCTDAYCDINFTQNKILGTPLRMVNGVPYSLHEAIGLPEHCLYTDMIGYWARGVDDADREMFLDFFSPERIILCYQNGERLLTYPYRTKNAFDLPKTVILRVRLYKNFDTGDLYGLGYIREDTTPNNTQRHEDIYFADKYKAVSDRAAFLERMSQNVPGGYHRCATGDGFPLEFVSDSFLDIVGWTREEISKELDNCFINIVAPEDREFFMSHEPALVRDGQISVAYRIHQKDGTRRWVQDSTLHVASDMGEYYQCTLADITDFVYEQEELSRKNLELLQEKNLFATIEENMPSGYHRCRAEPGCPFIYIGKHFMEIIGYTQEEIERDFDNCYANLICEEDAAARITYEQMLEMRGRGNAYDTSIYRIRHKDGGYRWVTDSTMFVDLGENSFLQGTIADITQYIDSLTEAREQAEASNLAKSTFLFNASHDIRTPMNAIKGYAHIIECNADKPDMVRETVQKLQQAGNILLTLMNDILELSRIERGKENIHLRPLNMRHFTEELYEMMRTDMAESGITFRMENDLSHPHVMADELKLSRMAMNLLSNAKKFTPAGGEVTFGIRESDFDGTHATYALVVRDTGIGMSEEFQERAFEQFERERSSTDSGIAGSGLGLAIIKKIVDLLGGTVTIHSTLGEGTEIICTIPLLLAEESDVLPDIPLVCADFTGKRILLVEDNEFNMEIARYVFESVGFMIDSAQNGVECLEKLTAAEPGHYDFILMDLQMPVMDGYRATREIRQYKNPAIANIPIIAMTANAFEEDRRRCFDVGMNGHIAKPLEAKAVLQELTRVLSKEGM